MSLTTKLVVLLKSDSLLMDLVTRVQLRRQVNVNVDESIKSFSDFISTCVCIQRHSIIDSVRRRLIDLVLFNRVNFFKALILFLYKYCSYELCILSIA